MKEIKVSQEKADKYYELVEKWSYIAIDSNEKENELIQVIKDLLDENQAEMEFEAIIITLNILTTHVHLPKSSPVSLEDKIKFRESL